MKDKVLMLVLGILIGAVITAGCFLLFSKSNNNMPVDMTGGRMRSEDFDPSNIEDGNFIRRNPQEEMNTLTSEEQSENNI